MAGGALEAIFSPDSRSGVTPRSRLQNNRAVSASAGGRFLEVTALYPTAPPAMARTRPGSVEKFISRDKGTRLMLPACIVKLIQSYLPRKRLPRRPCMYKSFVFDYMSTDDWQDVQDTRAYGDF